MTAFVTPAAEVTTPPNPRAEIRRLMALRAAAVGKDGDAAQRTAAYETLNAMPWIAAAADAWYAEHGEGRGSAA